ncbi:MAG: hypothetical protein A2X28_08490 [Elusimicrobia bacterium GWA2_56_46]|nr:MAG: hypothetical protein A2X28_08490 [Elusimicrobia bacterium GWA2_56_46]OGR55175.1 MAG: hypothetical protein A2X39_01395 [Elusimicrobia bacterium GWC2_56_31]HBB67854.1 hypothetical protein [Elusimicrobiota bacterium]HBW23752.1 hypothetical protein [Elusimicrobiota bacterium]
MKSISKYVLFAAALGCFGSAAHARRGDLRHEDVVIEKGQTMSGDVATDKSITVNGVLNGAAVSVGGASVTVNGEVTGDLVSIGGSVYIPGRVEGDVASVGGPVAISGKVGGDVSSVGGGVELSGAGEVDGDISALGGLVVKGEKTVHRGEVNNFDMRMVRTVLPRVLRMARYDGDQERGAAPWLIGGLIGLGLLVFFSILATGAILLLLPAVFFPKNVENAAAVISGEMWRACGAGALMVVVFFPGLLMMVVSILGIPLVPFALILYGAACVLGLSAFSVVLQGRFFEGIKKTGPSGLPGKVAAGYALMAGLLFFGKLIPFVGGILSLIGFLLLFSGTMMGLGAVWMTRMGSRSHAPTARPPVQPSPAPPVQ